MEQAQRVQVSATHEASGIRIPVAAENRYHISGKILDSSAQNGAQNYSVTITARSFGVSWSRGGTFTITGISAGEYQLRAIAPGGVRWGFATVHVVDSDVHQDIEIASLTGEGGAEPPWRVRKAFPLVGLPIRMRSVQAIKKVVLDEDGNFNIQGVLPGDYTFSLPNLSARPPGRIRLFGAFEIDNELLDDLNVSWIPAAQRAIYLKGVTCSGRDYTTQPFTIRPGEIIADCKVTLAVDTGTVSGKVDEKNRPSAGLDVVLIPKSRELRQVERYTLKGQTDVKWPVSDSRHNPRPLFSLCGAAAGRPRLLCSRFCRSQPEQRSARERQARADRVINLTASTMKSPQ